MELLNGGSEMFPILLVLHYSMPYTLGPRESLKIYGHMLYGMLVTYATNFELRMDICQRSCFPG
jgi:hypothetical protein